MCHDLQTLYFLVEKTEMDDLIKRKFWLVVKHCDTLSSISMITFFLLAFTTKLNGKMECHKVRLVVQGQHMEKKDVSGSGDFEDSFSSVTHTSVLLLKMVIIARYTSPSPSGYPEDSTDHTLPYLRVTFDKSFLS